LYLLKVFPYTLLIKKKNFLIKLKKKKKIDLGLLLKKPVFVKEEKQKDEELSTKIREGGVLFF